MSEKAREIKYVYKFPDMAECFIDSIWVKPNASKYETKAALLCEQIRRPEIKIIGPLSSECYEQVKD